MNPPKGVAYRTDECELTLKAPRRITPDSRLLGTLSFSGPAVGGNQAGTYDITPGGLYANQQGYALNFVNGSLTINKAPLTVTGMPS